MEISLTHYHLLERHDIRAAALPKRRGGQVVPAGTSKTSALPIPRERARLGVRSLLDGNIAKQFDLRPA